MERTAFFRLWAEVSETAEPLAAVEHIHLLPRRCCRIPEEPVSHSHNSGGRCNRTAAAAEEAVWNEESGAAVLFLETEEVHLYCGTEETEA